MDIDCDCLFVSGCAIEGVSKIDISLETQTVLVHAHPPATFDIVREKIAKTGKTINSSEVVVP
jgi:hypothetical protein